MDYKAVKVTWIDPYSIDEWREVSKTDYKVVIIESFGYEIHIDDDVAVFALNIDTEENKVSCTMIVPHECIKKYEYIEFEDE